MLSPEALVDLIPAVRELSVKAGHAALAFYDNPEAESKDDGSPLTKADLASHQTLVAGLPAIYDVPVVSEESTDQSERRADVTFWLVDPLDGTKEFIKKNGDFTVNVALIRDGAPLLGVVYAPVPELMYWGVVGQGAGRSDGSHEQAIHVAGNPQAEEILRVVASKSHRGPELEAFLERLGPHDGAARGSSLKLCMVADGSAHLYPRIGPTCEWDTAAAHAVVVAAGGRVTDLAGDPLLYGKPDVLNPFFMVDGTESVDWRSAVQPA